MDWADATTDILGYSINPAVNTVDLGYSGGGSSAPNWLDSIGSILGSGANAYATIKGANASAHQQVAPNGLQYVNGQFSAGTQGISNTMLLVGAGLLLFMFLKD